jgi:NADH-quinone oxidoreductase subunit C
LSSDDQDRPTEPSADEVTDPALQAEIGNPAASNQPTGAEAAPGDSTTAADEGPIAAPGAPGELHSDETPPQGEAAPATAPPTPADASKGAGPVDVKPEVDEPAPISAYARPPEDAAPATAPEQPAPAPEPEAPAAAEPELPIEPQAEADAAAAESTEVAEGERAGDEVPPAPDEVVLSEAHQALADELRAALGDAVVDTWARETGDLWVRVDVARWRDAAEAAKALGFTYFCYLSAIDWLPSPFGKSEEGVARAADEVRTRIEEGLRDLEHGVTGGETRFQLLARVFSIARRVGITFKADLPDDGPVAETWSGVYAGANWMERETHEMFGIGFAGHPYLVNLYLPGAFEGYPLRKDFPLLAREVKPWPGLVDVEPMPGEAPSEEPVEAGAEG